jgi:ribosomal protein L22
LAPVKTIEEAQYFLKNGKKMEKPVPEKKEKEKKAEKPDKTPAKAAK